LAVDQSGNPLTTDQAGNPRVNVLVDMGAYETSLATVLVVDRTDDLPIATCTSAANDCTLRGAINIANTLSGTDTISFDSSVFTPGTITLTGSLPQITTDMNIAGLDRILVIIDGAGSYQPFSIASGATVNMSGLTVQNSYTNQNGGAIYNQGMLAVTDSAFSQNTADQGAGIYSLNGTLTVTNSAFSQNTALLSGTGIHSRFSTLVVTGSTFSENTAGYSDGAGITISGGTAMVTDSAFLNNGNVENGSFGGGLSISSSTVMVINSTFSGNVAALGGGIYAQGSSTTVINSTISGNTHYDHGGGGIAGVDNQNLNLYNSILANNNGGDCFQIGTMAMTIKNSLIEDGSCGITAGVNGNLTGDPNLGALMGSPAYFPLNDGSIAINAGDNALVPNGVTTDQSGNQRIIGGQVDMGSYESSYVPPAPTITTQPQSQTIFSGQTADLSVVANGSNLSYQWYVGNNGDTSTPVGTDSDSFTTPALTSTTNYWVRVSNPGGDVDSNTATVMVEGAPTITAQPQSQTIFSGQTADLSVVASGSSLSYQWYEGSSGDTSSPIGVDSNSFTTPALTNTTNYWVRVSNPAGSTDSNTATITVGTLNTAPTADPGGPYAGAVNTAVAFDGSASSDPEADSLTYAWDFGDSTSGTDVMPTHSYSAAGTYNVCLTVNDGALDSESVCTQAIIEEPTTAFPTTSILDDFNRANGKVGGNWAISTRTRNYKIAGNQLDVQLGGALIWKPDSFGVNQEAFITLQTIDQRSPTQGLLLKAQAGDQTDAGVIIVVYDAGANAVRVSTLNANRPIWTNYGNTPAVFANGDQLGARALADGTVEVYQNGTLIATVTLNADDQAFFNDKGGRIGLWTLAAPNAVLDDFGGGDTTLP